MLERVTDFLESLMPIAFYMLMILVPVAGVSMVAMIWVVLLERVDIDWFAIGQWFVLGAALGGAFSR